MRATALGHDTFLPQSHVAKSGPREGEKSRESETKFRENRLPRKETKPDSF